MMVSEPEKVQLVDIYCLYKNNSIFCSQWVDDMADAGADQYTFHLEATSESTVELICTTHIALSLGPSHPIPSFIMLHAET